MSDSRIGMPSLYATIRWLKFSARSSLPEDLTVKSRAEPCNTPDGRLLFAFWIALTTLSSPSPRLDSASGFRNTRTA